MTITNEPVTAGQPVKFIVKGWPEEEAVKSAISRFYGLKPGADRNFTVYNVFAELIMSGVADEAGQVGVLKFHDRRESEKN